MDFILNAQDINLEWLDSLKVKKISSERYNVYIFDFFLNRYDSVQLKVAKKKDKYIIDDIFFRKRFTAVLPHISFRLMLLSTTTKPPLWRLSNLPIPK